MHPKLEGVVTARNISLVGLISATIFLVAGMWLPNDPPFSRSIFISLFGTSLSVALSVYFIPTIIKTDQETRGQERREKEDSELLEYLNESRMQYIQLEARVAKLGHLDRSNEEFLKEISIAGFSLLEGIEHEKENLSIHTSRIIGYTHPVIESRKTEYLHHLRQLRSATRNLLYPQDRDRKEASRQFEIARGEALMARDALSKALEASQKERNQID